MGREIARGGTTLEHYSESHLHFYLTVTVRTSVIINFQINYSSRNLIVIISFVTVVPHHDSCSRYRQQRFGGVSQPTLEPTGDLDSETANEIMDLMTDLNKNANQTFVIVSHSQEVGERTNRIVRMRDGLIVDDGNRSST